MGAYRGRRPARRPTTTWNGLIDRGRRRDGHSIASPCASAISSSRRQLPFAAASGVTYGQRRFRRRVFNKALEISDPTPISFQAPRREEQKERQSCAGIAVGLPISKSPAPPSGELGKITFEPDGSVKLTTGTLDYGQGHATPFRAGAVGAARRSLREDHAGGRTTADPRALRQRHRRNRVRSPRDPGQAIVEILRAGGRERQAGRSPYPGSFRKATIEFADGRFTTIRTAPAPTASIGIHGSSPSGLREGKMPEGARRPSLDVDHATKDTAHRPSRTGCPRRGSRDRPGDRRGLRSCAYTGVNDFRHHRQFR